MLKFSFFILCYVFITLHVSKGLKSPNPQRTTDHRINIKHKTSYFDKQLDVSQDAGTKDASTKDVKTRPNACLYHHCSLGEKCQLTTHKRPTCVCRHHCKPAEKPLCGTDGRFYRNHCEMHRTACIEKVDIFDAKHMDCFYKRYHCEKTGFSDLLTKLLATYDVIEDDDDVSKDEPYDVIKVLTNDDREDIIKKIFKKLDVDKDGLVGNKDIFEYSTISSNTAYEEDLFHPPCTLFHLLHFADTNHDNALDMKELFHVYNITVLELNDDEQEIQVTAIQGEHTVVECGIRGEESPVWRRYGHLIEDESVSVNGRNLIIDHTSLYNAGNYSCHARRHEDLYQTIILSVFTKPKVQVYQTTNRVILGESVTIKCFATGIPTPDISWLKNGAKLVSDGNHLILDSGRIFHINEATYEDSASYTCVGENMADSQSAAVQLFVNDLSTEQDIPFGINKAAYYVFHQNGISIMEPQSCITIGVISAEDAVPGLLRQNKLCDYSPTDGQRSCTWSKSVQAGPRFLYVGQPKENRLIVMDLKTQSVDEVITTDPSPAKLFYYEPLDEIFVLSNSGDEYTSSIISVIYAASISGFHSAARIQPSINSATSHLNLPDHFHYLPKNLYDANLKHAFVPDKDTKKIYKLNLETQLFEKDAIDLTQYNCSPRDVYYRPIGGILDITCQNDEGDDIIDNLSIDYNTNVLLSITAPDKLYDTEYISASGNQIVRVNTKQKSASIYTASYHGDINLAVVIRTSFEISNVMFRQHQSYSQSTVIYLASSLQGEILSVDVSSGEIETLEDLEHYDFIQEWVDDADVMTPSGWYERFIATGGTGGFSVVDVDMNDVSCRNNDVIKPQLITWVDDCKEC